MSVLAITEDATLRCDHDGKLENKPSQDLLTIEGKRVLVEPDPQDRHIHLCPNTNLSNKACGRSLVVEEGYSTFVSVEGAAVCLATVKGHTDGTPPGLVFYTVRVPGQDFVTVES
ncbi:MAG TPA: hypothetical protein VGF86_15430 [Candidatus Tumulicola sp.]|jgi:hypothetical protein